MTKKISEKMWLFMAVVEESIVPDILNGLLELEVKGATIINSQGMGRTLASEFPIFAGLMNELKGSKPYNKTIFAAVDDINLPDRLQKILLEIDLDFTQPNTGVMFMLPIVRAMGTNFDFKDNDI
ncbi:MAG: hypothetical protein H8D42_05915 [Candidatus Marinimicrobia bacterium]|nr:hypothetical protein [Candidatus Neomarinimicrobiota bacterium]